MTDTRQNDQAGTGFPIPETALTSSSCFDRAAKMLALGEQKARLGSEKSVKAAIAMSAEYRRVGTEMAKQEAELLESEDYVDPLIGASVQDNHGSPAGVVVGILHDGRVLVDEGRHLYLFDRSDLTPYGF